jgi:hypothetical protein
MNRDRLKNLLTILKSTVAELESEIKSDVTSYGELGSAALDYDYSELITYFNSNDDDGDLD